MNPSQITALASMLAPGLIISGILSRVTTGRIPDVKDKILSYGVISAAYYAVARYVFNFKGGWEISEFWWGLDQYIIVPCVLGLLLAYAYQKNVLYNAADRIGLRLAHHHPASWDFVFEKLPEETYILVTLLDGTKIAGRWAEGSFAASDKDERDLFITEIWEKGENDTPWGKINPDRRMLLCGKDIRYIDLNRSTRQ